MSSVVDRPVAMLGMEELFLAHIAKYEESKAEKIRRVNSPKTVSQHLGAACLYAYRDQCSIESRRHLKEAEEGMQALAPHLPSTNRKKLSLLESYVDLAAEDVTFTENLPMRRLILIDLLEDEVALLRNSDLTGWKRESLYGDMNENTALALLTRTALSVTAIPALRHHDQGRLSAGNYDLLAADSITGRVQPVQIKSSHRKKKYNAGIKYLPGVGELFDHGQASSRLQRTANLLIREAGGDISPNTTAALDLLSAELISRIFD